MAVQCLETAARHGEKQDIIFVENLANLYLQSGQYARGITMLEGLMEKRPGDTHTMFMLGQAWYAQKKYKEAIEWWEKALAADDTQYRALYMTGMAMQKMGKQKKGEEICDQAIAKDPSLARMRIQVDNGSMQ
jgi:tetratricopeptide (TPR) repeat protein